MKSPYFILMIGTLLFSSCNQNQNQVPELGSIDSTVIAQDTVMQKAIESSYEYSKSLTVSEKLVYDVVAFGGPASRGEYAIIRRAEDDKPDTVAHENRNGIIANTNIDHLSKQGNPVILVEIEAADSTHEKMVNEFECPKKGKAIKLAVKSISN